MEHQEDDEKYSSEYLMINCVVIVDDANSTCKIVADIDLATTDYGSSDDILIASLFLRCQGLSSGDIVYSNFKLFDVTNSVRHYELCEVDRITIDNCIACRYTAQKADAYQKLIGSYYENNDNITPKTLTCPIIIPAYSSNLYLYDFLNECNIMPVDSTEYSLKLWSQTIKKFKVEFQFNNEINIDTKYKLWVKLLIKKEN